MRTLGQTARRTARSTALAALLALLLAAWPVAAGAQSLTLSNLVVDNQAGSFMARFGVGIDGLAEITDNLQNGVTLDLVCKVRLTQAKNFFSSPTLATAELVSRLKYDALTREYTLSLPGREPLLRNPRLEDLLKSGWGSLAMDLGSWRSLERGQDYVVSLDIKLQQSDIPNWFRRTLFFWSWDVAPTTSYQLHFKY